MKLIRNSMAVILVLTFANRAMPEDSTSIYSQYKKKVAAADSTDPAEQMMIALWCLDNDMGSRYTHHYGLFLKSRGENKRRRNPDGYCSVCNGQEEYVCDVCDTKRRVKITCPKCLGTKKSACSRCEGTGKVTCKRCKGTGRYRKVEITTGAGGHVRTRTINCLKEVKCGHCRGKMIVRCESCRGKGTKRELCTSCNRYRFKKCSACTEQRGKFIKLVEDSSLAVDKDPLPDQQTAKPPTDLSKVSLVERGNALLAEGLALDKQAVTASAPYSLMKKAGRKYEEAVNCYKAAQKKGHNVDKELKEALTMLFWLRKMMPIR